jgi:hypothetical protein
MIMDVKESDDGLTLTIKTDKRINAFQIHKVNDSSSMFKIRYEDSNTDVPVELQGFYTGRREALKALTFWIEHAKPTKDKEWEDKYKDTVVPELKTKPVKPVKEAE